MKKVFKMAKGARRRGSSMMRRKSTPSKNGGEEVVTARTPPSPAAPKLRLVITVEIGDGRVGEINVHEGDSEEILATNFCKKYSLEDAMVPMLTQHIKNNIAENALQSDSPKVDASPKRPIEDTLEAVEDQLQQLENMEREERARQAEEQKRSQALMEQRLQKQMEAEQLDREMLNHIKAQQQVIDETVEQFRKPIVQKTKTDQERERYYNKLRDHYFPSENKSKPENDKSNVSRTKSISTSTPSRTISTGTNAVAASTSPGTSKSVAESTGGTKGIRKQKRPASAPRTRSKSMASTATARTGATPKYDKLDRLHRHDFTPRHYENPVELRQRELQWSRSIKTDGGKRPASAPRMRGKVKSATNNVAYIASLNQKQHSERMYSTAFAREEKLRDIRQQHNEEEMQLPKRVSHRAFRRRASSGMSTDVDLVAESSSRLYEDAVKSREYLDKYYKLKRREAAEKELKDCTFTPKISKLAQMLSSNASITDSVNVVEQKKLQSMRNQQRMEELKECSFHPDISERSRQLATRHRNNMSGSRRNSNMSTSQTQHDKDNSQFVFDVINSKDIDPSINSSLYRPHEVLYQEAAERRQRKHSFSVENQPKHSFTPEISENTKELYQNSASIPKDHHDKDQFIERLTKSNQAKKKHLEKLKNKYHNEPFQPRIKRGPHYARNTSNLPIGDFLYAARHEFDDIKKQLADRDTQRLQSLSRKRKTSAASEQMVQNLIDRKYETMYHRLLLSYQAPSPTGTEPGEEALLNLYKCHCDELSLKFKHVVEPLLDRLRRRNVKYINKADFVREVARAMDAHVGQLPGKAFIPAVNVEATVPSKAVIRLHSPLSKKNQGKEQVYEKTYVKPIRKSTVQHMEKGWAHHTFKPEVNQNSVNRRQRSDSIEDHLIKYRSKLDGKKEQLREKHSSALMKEHTFRPDIKRTGSKAERGFKKLYGSLDGDANATTTERSASLASAVEHQPLDPYQELKKYDKDAIAEVLSALKHDIATV